MPEKLEIEVLDCVVRASVSGRFSLNNAKTFIQEILRRACEENLDKILIDTRGITTEVLTTDRFEIGVHLAVQRPGATKIAFVSTEDQVWPDRFMETVSTNRGVLAKAFTDTEEALNWLSKQPAIT